MLMLLVFMQEGQGALGNERKHMVLPYKKLEIIAFTAAMKQLVVKISENELRF